MRTKVGIIGCGGIAAHHVDGYQKNGAEIVGLTDLNGALAEAMLAKVPNARVFATFEELLDSGQVEAVSICTPPSTHEVIAIHALARRTHVMCEKPLAHTLESGQRIAEAARKSDVRFMTAFRHRFVPAIVKVRELIQAGRIGELVFVNNIFCGSALAMKDRWFSKKAISGGGTMMDTSSHSVDIFRFLAGEIAQQQALTHRTMPSIDVEDSSILTVRSESGVLGSFTASWVAGESVAVLEVVGQKGRITFDYRNGTEIGIKVTGTTEWERIPVAPSLGFAEELAHFLDAIRTKDALACSVHDGFRALEIIQRAYGY